MEAATERPWLALYDDGVPAEFTPACRNGVELCEVGERLRPDSSSIYYFDHALSFREAGADAHALAVALRAELRVRPGDRVALMMQNVPHLPIAIHAAWLAGAIVTPVSPMYRQRELVHQLTDSGARVMLCLESLFHVVEGARDESPLEHVVTLSELEYLDSVPASLANHERIECQGAWRFAELLAAHAGERAELPDPAPEDPAILVYTSGTTGLPKGAINTHGGIAYNAEIFQRWVHLTFEDVTVAMAPLFHSSGLIGHFAVSRLAAIPLLLSYRFDAAEMLRLIERWRGSWMLGPLTAFIALIEHPDFERRDLSSLTKVGSGGAPVLPVVVERYERSMGTYVHNMYGMSETTAPSHLVPMGQRAPVDRDTGALAIGVPVCGVDSKIVSVEDGSDLPPGEIGEIVTRGPMVVPGYWNRPEATASAIRDGWLHTGDIGKRDEQGWFYLVDRLKDMINVSGFKVWPRDVEDVLHQHPAVREAAVVGVPDSYRGERVKAFVSLRPGASATPDELIAHCRSVMAAYKVPREIEILDEIPKSAAGKTLRRELRERRAPGWLDDLGRLLEPLPTAEGGAALVVASADSPPALALLSTGDVFLDGTEIRIAVHRGSSVARRLGGSCSIVVPGQAAVLRVEVTPATARAAGPVDVIEGTVAAIRPTSEPPWVAEMAFRPRSSNDVQGTLDYWAAVREWLAGGAEGDGPEPPVPGAEAS